MKKKKWHWRGLCTLTVAALCMASPNVKAQSEIYPEHFNLEEVTLTGGPFLQAENINNELLLQYDVDRLLTPFIRQAGLSDDESSTYYNWTTLHPSFENWGLDSWSLEGHIGGHYLTALALAYAATGDEDMKAQLKERLDYMLNILNDCQRVFDDNTEGLKGFIGGQPLNQIWTGLYNGDLTEFENYGGWVPFYCEHKVLAGLRDAWLYTDSELAKTLFKNMCDWCILVVSNLTDTQMQEILGWEHGGMNEPLADAYRLFGESKYLDAAKKYSHEAMLDGMQTLNTSFLDGMHANTQVPKYIGFERIYQVADTSRLKYQVAAQNFWDDVAQNRTVCIGGNSVSEHFLAAANAENYIDNLEGPESCNTNNMLKLSEILFDETHDAQYADFYENATWNHILTTQDPLTGGYVYFTTLRPQGYRIYSTVNEGMWCCVGTGMENHSKYAHFAYTHSEDNGTLYVNLFVPSTLKNETFALTQETDFPEVASTKLTINQGGTFTLALRHPSWTTDGFSVTVNGEKVEISAVTGTASYVTIDRIWSEGDVVEVNLPMELRIEECPNLSSYISFKYGPILLGAATTAASEDDGSGLEYESLQNEYAHEGRMDHSPGAMALGLGVSTSPLLIGDRDSVLSLITKTQDSLVFTINVENEMNEGTWSTLQLKPFYELQHQRYMCYWYQATPEEYAASDMGLAEAEAEALNDRTVDYVATGEQQSEAGHDALYSNSTSGTYQGEFYRDCSGSGYVQYTLWNKNHQTDSMSIMCRFTTADSGRKGIITIDGETLAEVTIPSSVSSAESTGFYNAEYALPKSMLVDENGNVKDSIIFRIAPNGTSYAPGLYYVRLLNGCTGTSYTFVASEWTTGDSGRLSQSNISYDTEANTITAVAGTGSNNVCFTLTTDTEYNVPLSNKYLMVKGTNLSTQTTDSYLWWLNGVCYGTSVSPSVIGETEEGEVVVAWDITESGLNGNCTDEPWATNAGATIFGLTSTTGTSIISYIGFTSSLEEFLPSTTTYKWVATDWSTGDTGRLAASNISYDEDANTLTASPGTGNNNVCLTLNTATTNYTVPLSNKYLIVKGTNLSDASGASYLWWLNGKNQGSSVAPTEVTTAGDGDLVVAWDITQSGLNDNCTSDPWEASTGATIFGLTSTTGTSVISYIGFVPSVDDFLETVGIEGVSEASNTAQEGTYDLQGRQTCDDKVKDGIYIINGKKVAISKH